MTKPTGPPTSAPQEESSAALHSPLAVLRQLGAGLVAGIADNDPTSHGTLAIIGAATIYDLTWLVLLVLPMLLVIQVVSARVGIITRRNLEIAIRDHFGQRWVIIAMVLVLGVNLVTIGADLAGGAAALSLMTGLDWQWFVLPLAIGIGVLLTYSNYQQLQRVLQYILLVFVSYALAAFLARPDWAEVFRHSVVPTFQFNSVYTSAVLALLGTTLTSYVYVWQTIEQEEEQRTVRDLPLIELDAASGIAAAVLIFWFIVVATGATMGVHRQPVNTAEDAARALAPFAGELAELLFALGLLASAVPSIPVIAATSAYVTASAFRWKRGLNEPLCLATWHFYAVLLGSLIVGAGMSMLGLTPMESLFFAGIVGGLGTPVLLVLLLLLANSHETMGDYRIAGWIAVVGWISTAIVSLASLV